MLRLARHLWPAAFLACLVLPAKPSFAQNYVAAAMTASIPGPKVEASPEVSSAMSDLMTSSRAKFLEGYALIQEGKSDEARAAFDAAMDMLSASNWDLSQNAPLNTFFWDLAKQIKDVEATYLYAPDELDELQDGAGLQDGGYGGGGYDDDGEQVVELLSDEELSSLGLTVRDDPLLKQALTDAYWTQFDFPISVNDTVATYLDYLLTRGRKFFEDGLVRSGRYRPMMEQVFREEEIPLDLISLAHVESAFKPQALSKARAKGIWQFVQGTAQRYGLKVTRDIDERSDPEKSTRAAARYLKDLYALFGDWNLVLAAYNWGEGNVQRLMTNTGMSDFWQLSRLSAKNRRLPDQTKKHVPLIQASAILTRNPAKYGFLTAPDPQMAYATVHVSKPVDLRTVAKALGTTFDELKQLNPALRGNRTPANYPDFALRVPIDSNPDLYELIETLPTARTHGATEVAADGRHKVIRGDTLYSLARRYGVSVNDIRKANGLSANNIIKIGMTLDIPDSDGSAAKSPARAKKQSSKKSKSR
ncbi:MAG: transglycosylase SLT domain-containing protein [Acidobacteriota bacterium]|jgi:LysM repeat protein|nr:transglycosylase SLT domain-containing protein [Acidobacteriota bacterium]